MLLLESSWVNVMPLGELLVLVKSPEKMVQVGSGEAPVERHRGLFVRRWKPNSRCWTSARSVKSLVVSTLRCTMEK